MQSKKEGESPLLSLNIVLLQNTMPNPLWAKIFKNSIEENELIIRKKNG